MSHHRIESLLSARQFVHPQVVGDRLYFISDLSGRLSLYVMDVRGSVPDPLLPPDIALPNPHHLHGAVAYQVLPSLGQILLMLDRDGDENYQPMFLPIDGGRPEPVFGDRFAGQQVLCTDCDAERLLALFTVDPRTSPVHHSFRAHLGTLETTALGESTYGNRPGGHSPDMDLVLLGDGYTIGDSVVYLWREGQGDRRLLFGKPIEQRTAGEVVLPNGIRAAHPTEHGVLFVSSLFDDGYGLSYLPFDDPGAVQPVVISGLTHSGAGELTGLHHRVDNRFTVEYNIDGSSWAYEGALDEASRSFDVLRVLVGDEASRSFDVLRVLVGQGDLSGGVLESLDYDEASRRYALSFSTATSPAQLYVLEPDGALHRVTNERLLGIPSTALSRDLLHPRRPAEPGAARLHLVLHAADPVLHPQRLRGLDAQRARQQRLRHQLHEAGRP